MSLEGSKPEASAYQERPCRPCSTPAQTGSHYLAMGRSYEPIRLMVSLASESALVCHGVHLS
jgi:hypothetical protein